MLKRLLHAMHLGDGHLWVGEGLFADESIDGFSFVVERCRCECGASSWQLTRAASRINFNR